MLSQITSYNSSVFCLTLSTAEIKSHKIDTRRDNLCCCSLSSFTFSILSDIFTKIYDSHSLFDIILISVSFKSPFSILSFKVCVKISHISVSIIFWFDFRVPSCLCSATGSFSEISDRIINS